MAQINDTGLLDAARTVDVLTGFNVCTNSLGQIVVGISPFVDTSFGGETCISLSINSSRYSTGSFPLFCGSKHGIRKGMGELTTPTPPITRNATM